MAEPVDVEELPARLDPCLPIGLDVQVAAEIEPGTPSLQQVVTSCTWRIEVVGLGVAELTERVPGMPWRGLARRHPRAQGSQGHPTTFDPAILSLEMIDGTEMIAELATQPRGLRPSELGRRAGVAPG